MKVYRHRIYPTKAQERQMQTCLFLAKNLWNDLLEHCKTFYNDYGKFPTRDGLQIMAKGSGFHSQVSQEVAHRIERAIWRYVKLKKSGKKAGFPRFKSIDRMKSLHYPQYGNGFWLGEKLRITPFGEISIVKHREIKGKIKTLALKREMSGKWFACFCVEERPVAKASNGKPKVGMDLGLETLATFSDGFRVGNPRHLRKYAERLATLQRKMNGKKKGSKSRKKARRKIALAYEKVRNTRLDFLHKTAHSLVNSYSLIGLEDLASQEMAEQKFGKQINDAGWGELANMLRYKAASAGCEVVFVNPKDTTRMCCKCGSKKGMPLETRTYCCEKCGNTMDRDLNAAHNILMRATAGTAGSCACGDNQKEELSVKQEAAGFSPQ